ncbi:MAG: hypothetical protein E7L15_17670 [Citrobacter portucalensis]|nr:hypothetical protein [Citrobacter portucalensis]
MIDEKLLAIESLFIEAESLMNEVVDSDVDYRIKMVLKGILSNHISPMRKKTDSLILRKENYRLPGRPVGKLDTSDVKVARWRIMHFLLENNMKSTKTNLLVMTSKLYRVSKRVLSLALDDLIFEGLLFIDKSEKGGSNRAVMIKLLDEKDVEIHKKKAIQSMAWRESKRHKRIDTIVNAVINLSGLDKNEVEIDFVREIVKKIKEARNIAV